MKSGKKKRLLYKPAYLKILGNGALVKCKGIIKPWSKMVAFQFFKQRKK